MAQKRMYVVIDKETQKPVGLINATHPAQAHVAHWERITEVRLASQQDVYEAAHAGLQPRDAREDQCGAST